MAADLSLNNATVGIMTALPEELAATRCVFSQATPVSSGSGSVYYLSSVPCVDGERVVAIANLAKMGTNCAAIETTQLLGACPSMTDVIMVGIAGAIPCPEDASRHVRLGDLGIVNK